MQAGGRRFDPDQLQYLTITFSGQIRTIFSSLKIYSYSQSVYSKTHVEAYRQETID